MVYGDFFTYSFNIRLRCILLKYSYSGYFLVILVTSLVINNSLLRLICFYRSGYSDSSFSDRSCVNNNITEFCILNFKRTFFLMWRCIFGGNKYGALFGFGEEIGRSKKLKINSEKMSKNGRFFSYKSDIS